jgi:hypothetical protein
MMSKYQNVTYFFFFLFSSFLCSSVAVLEDFLVLALAAGCDTLVMSMGEGMGTRETMGTVATLWSRGSIRGWACSIGTSAVVLDDLLGLDFDVFNDLVGLDSTDDFEALDFNDV